MIDLIERAGIAMNVRGQFSEPIADPKVTLGALAFANDLGRLLVRIKAGQETKPATIRKATLLFAQMIRLSGRFKRSRFTGLKHDERRDQRAGSDVERAKVDIVERFALRVLDEWINDQCVRCEGRGIVRRDGRYICPDCAGSGKRPLDEAARALAIGISLDEYRRHWSRRFHDMHALLDNINGSVSDTMRRQLRG
ncbi:hypothetical protein KTD28_06635 [Burkholderia gladioli]|uniref:hypothetical protein n=1 Tax=Burkholderia gladioli TaxID=28095 RepID=UPI000CFF15FC|nr:hypothetical protein [Burkholderia gladioli]MBA1367044.1 hypothetical protein [Burkholderia gladioli]MBU9154284.1 hypothetical protein [Burkholderia gladioli]MBU9166188.1 hypothetical protein [Burkholderia gladioli]PRG92334.1 hypothetical protein C6V08_29030 [Burkholderia gladioli]